MVDAAVLSKVGGFMQQLDEANRDLQNKISTQGREAVDIEEVDETDQHIEMVSSFFYEAVDLV